PLSVPYIQKPDTVKSVDVCLTNYNLGKYLPFALESLAGQTTDDFNLFVIDDGSTDPETIEIFAQLKEKYRGKTHWHFVTQTNQGVCAARNLGARLGETEYIIFMDAANIVAPNMVERFLESIRLSGDDCLTCWLYQFEGEGSVYVEHGNPERLVPPRILYTPLGNAPTLNLLSTPFGDTNAIIKRSVFEAIGGFTMDYPKDVNQEDRELLTVLSLEGYKLDVIPEFLCYYRYRPESRLRVTNEFENQSRVLRVYARKLADYGLSDMAHLLVGQRAAQGAFNGQYASQDGNVLFA